MYRIGYIDDHPDQYRNYSKKLKRRYKDVELILLEDCNTREEFLEKIYEERIEVLLVDYKMAGSYGFNGSTLINFINDQMRDLECFILTAVEQEQINDGLVTRRNRYSKTIFDTEGDDPERVKQLGEFVETLRQSADVFKRRSEEKKKKYLLLFEKRKNERLSLSEEEEYLRLYEVLSSYGMIEKLPENVLRTDFEERLDKLLALGDQIIKKYDQ